MALPKEHDTKLWLALLRELEMAGGAAKPSDIYPRMRNHFPEVSDEDLQGQTRSGANQWEKRIQFVRQNLVERGCIDGSQRGVWSITKAGSSWVQANWHGSDADYSSIAKPSFTKGPRPARRPAGPEPAKSATLPGNGSLPGRVEPPGPTLPPEPMLMADSVEALCQRLRASQRQSSASQQFENDVCEAFRFLGFQAERIGGSGDTDVFLEAHLGRSSYRVVVDAKSTQHGRVADAHIRWLAIKDHQAGHRAEFAAVVGEEFSDGQLQKYANQHQVALITTGMLCEILHMHSLGPFGLFELKHLFSSPGRAEQGMGALREHHDLHQRHWQVISEIVNLLDRRMRERPDSPELTAYGIGLLLDSKAYSQEPFVSHPPTKPEFQQAIAFLTNAAVGVMTELPDSDGALQLTMTAGTARKRLQALARSLNEG